MRIAILLANNDDSPFSLRFPNDGDKVAGFLLGLRPEWQCRIWAVRDNQFPTLTDADAFIITGSPASVHDPLPWITRLSGLITHIVAANKPLVGLCFGHQLIAQALGGAVERSASGWRFGVATTHILTSPAWMSPAQCRLRLFASHSEQVTRLPRGAIHLGAGANCPYASYAIGTGVVTTQYHPEFRSEFMKALALEYQGELPEDVLTQGTAELDLATDGALFFVWIARFLESAALMSRVPSVDMVFR
jgi:GMP synthase-like glutamine amidotransferase